MQAITTIGLDIAKSVFQVHGIDAEGNVILRRQLKRRYVLVFFQKLPPCLVGIELRLVASLVARTPGSRPHRSLDAAIANSAVGPERRLLRDSNTSGETVRFCIYPVSRPFFITATSDQSGHNAR